jgi:hypothetical protein
MRKILTAAVLAAMSFNASAALVDYGPFTYDSNQNLDWLDLTTTLGMPVASVLAANPTWRFATNAEVENLFAEAFNTYADTDTTKHLATMGNAPSELANDAATFQSLFGFYLAGETAAYTYGLYEDEDGIWRNMGTFRRTGGGYTAVYSTEYTSDYSSSLNGQQSFGTYLVRTSTVPIPATAWLFGSALIGLVGVGRGKL